MSDLNIDKELEKIVELYDAAKLFQASRALYSLEKRLEAASVTETRLLDSKYDRIRIETDEVSFALEELNSTHNWISSYDGVSTKVWYREEKERKNHSIKVEGVVDAPLLNLLALVIETQLYHDLFWFFKSCQTLAEMIDTRKAIYMDLKAPWPLTDRDLPAYGYAVDGLDEDHCILVLCRSLDACDVDMHGKPIPIPQETSKNVRVDLPFAAMELCPVDITRTKVRIIGNCDPQLPIVPLALVNWGARTVCRWSLKILESKAASLEGTPYGKIMETKDIYVFIQGRLRDFWRQKGRENDFLNGVGNNFANEMAKSQEIDPTEKPGAPSKKVMTAFLKGSFF